MHHVILTVHVMKSLTLNVLVKMTVFVNVRRHTTRINMEFASAVYNQVQRNNKKYL